LGSSSKTPRVGIGLGTLRVGLGSNGDSAPTLVSCRSRSESANPGFPFLLRLFRFCISRFRICSPYCICLYALWIHALYASWMFSLLHVLRCKTHGRVVDGTLGYPFIFRGFCFRVLELVPSCVLHSRCCIVDTCACICVVRKCTLSCDLFVLCFVVLLFKFEVLSSIFCQVPCFLEVLRCCTAEGEKSLGGQG